MARDDYEQMLRLAESLMQPLRDLGFVTPSALALHAPNHQTGGSDPVKLDDLAAPDDNTDLNASASAHGLLPKLSGTVTEFLNGTGVFSTPAGAGGNAQVEEVYTGEAASLGSDTLLTFILTLKPLSTDSVRLYINGALQRNGSDFSVGGLDNKRVTWLASSGTADFAIQGTDHITVAYEPN